MASGDKPPTFSSSGTMHPLNVNSSHTGACSSREPRIIRGMLKSAMLWSDHLTRWRSLPIHLTA